MEEKFTYQIAGTAREFTDFLTEHKKTGWFTAAVIFATWGVLGFRTDVGVDTEIMIAFPESMLSFWCGIGRYGLVFTKLLFGMGRFCQPAAVTAMMAALWMVCMAVDFSVYQWSGHDERYRFFYPVFSAVFVTSPCLAEQFYFLLQSFEVVWGILMTVLAVYGTSRYVYQKESVGWALLAILLGVWAFSSYQIMVVIFISLCAFSFLLVYQRGHQRHMEGMEQSRWKWFGLACSFVMIFAAIMAAYGITSSLVRMVTGTDSSYTDSLILWKRDGVRDCLYRVWADMKNIYLGKRPPFFSPTGLPILALFTALFLKRGWASGEKERLLYVMAGGIFLSSPVFMTIVTGFYQGIRIQMVYPFVLAISAAALTTVTKSGVKTAFRTCAALGLSASLAWSQWVISERLLDTMHQASVQDIKRCQDIYREAQRLTAREGGDIRQKSLVFVGIREMDTNLSTLRGDAIGCSIFQWDSEGPHGVSDRVRTLMSILGLLHEPATTEQYVTACERAKTMPNWPLEGSIVLENDMVIIRLSDPTP